MATLADMIRVLLVDDDPLVRSGLRLMLAAADDIQVVAEAADGCQVLPLVDQHAPDLVLMDIRMPTMDGLAATKALCGRPGGPEVIVLTTFTTDNYVLRALQAGAAGFLLKHTPPAQLVAAVRSAAAGEPVLSPEAIRRLIDAVAAGAPVSRPATDTVGASRLALLSDRELEVARGIGRGMTNAEIAAELYMSVPTVKAHVSHILTKLELNNRVQIALAVGPVSK
jgi:DNA-binding NarL/FixJ family response regulator